MGAIPCKNLQVVRNVDDDDDDNDIIDKEVRNQIEAAFNTLQCSETCVSLLKKTLTKDIFDATKNKTTLYGATLLDVVRSGVRNLDSEVGVYAPDAESYTVFAPLFNIIIEEFHDGFKAIDRHPPCNYGDPQILGNLDEEGRFVLSTRVRAARSIQGYPLNSLMTRDQYSGIESRLFTTLTRLTGEVAGDYYPLSTLPARTQQLLTDDDMMMSAGDRFLQAANACRDWPVGRGVFLNADRTFVVWVNGADHMRVVSQQRGGDLAAVYRRLVDGLTQLESRVNFSKSSRLGFVTFSPSELGCALRVSVRVRLPRMASDLGKLMQTAARLNLLAQGTVGDRHTVQGGVLEVCNKRTMGVSEISVVQELADGVKELIRLEKFS